MSLLKVVFSPLGSLSPRAFTPAVMLVYAAGLLSYLLLMASVTAIAGALAFLLAQAIVTWTWCMLHAKRLRDCDRPTGLALAIAALYALAVILFLLVIMLIASGDTAQSADAMTHTNIDLFAVLGSISMILRHPDFGATGYLILAFLALSFLPVAIALCFSLWVGTRASAPAKP
jgi:uncharacterized membrane protein YhaH (DUF805 family)